MSSTALINVTGPLPACCVAQAPNTPARHPPASCLLKNVKRLTIDSLKTPCHITCQETAGPGQICRPTPHRSNSSRTLTIIRSAQTARGHNTKKKDSTSPRPQDLSNVKWTTDGPQYEGGRGRPNAGANQPSQTSGVPRTQQDQPNVHNSKTAQAYVLNTANPNDWDVLALQEPWIDSFGNS